MAIHPIAAVSRLTKRLTHLAIQSFNDPWARRLRFVAFLAGSTVMTQLWGSLLGGGRISLVLVFLAAIVWILVYPIMWLRVAFVFIWFPGRRKAHRIKVPEVSPGSQAPPAEQAALGPGGGHP